MKQIIVVETIQAQPGKYEALKQALLEMVAPSLNEKGCLQYEIAESENKQNVLVLMRWENIEAFKNHGHAPHIQEFVRKYEKVLFGDFEETCWIVC